MIHVACGRVFSLSQSTEDEIKKTAYSDGFDSFFARFDRLNSDTL